MHFTPLIFENLDYAWSFSAELSPEGLIGISGSVLRFVDFVHIMMLLFMRRDETKGSYVLYMKLCRNFFLYCTNCSY
jgi:hypothetical protein